MTGYQTGGVQVFAKARPSRIVLLRALSPVVGINGPTLVSDMWSLSPGKAGETRVVPGRYLEDSLLDI